MSYQVVAVVILGLGKRMARRYEKTIELPFLPFRGLIVEEEVQQEGELFEWATSFDEIRWRAETGTFNVRRSLVVELEKHYLSCSAGLEALGYILTEELVLARREG